MAIRDTLRQNAAPYLKPGENIESVFCAQTTSQWFALLSIWIIILKKSYRVIVATDRRILVAQGGRFRTTKVEEILRVLPRDTTIGPASGLWYKTDALGERMYIHKRFHKDVALADGN